MTRYAENRIREMRWLLDSAPSPEERKEFLTALFQDRSEWCFESLPQYFERETKAKKMPAFAKAAHE